MKVRGLVAAAALIALGTGAVIAQSDPIAARKELMKHNNDGAKVLVAMMRGTAPYEGRSGVLTMGRHGAEAARPVPG
jgi:cytochrome c556